jgi:lysyl-tRNA synthetase class 1
LQHAANWAAEIDTITTQPVELKDNERNAVLELAGIVNGSDDENYLQNVIFTLAKKHNIPTGQFFKTLYKILIGSESGPKLGPYIIAMGRQNVGASLANAAKFTRNE